MKVHADILKMAKTKEKRELIKWCHARQVFFREGRFIEGLELAQQCDHLDARFLVSLFSSGGGEPKMRGEAAAVFLAQGNDGRCLCWAAECNASIASDLLRRSAESGYAWGQAMYGYGFSHFVQPRPWLEKAVAQGERAGMQHLALLLWDGEFGSEDRPRARQLWQEAAELGDPDAQYYLATLCSDDCSLGQVIWLRRSVTQFNTQQTSLYLLIDDTEREVGLYDNGGSGRIVFELGMALHGRMISLMQLTGRKMHFSNMAVALFKQWCAEAKRAILCWIWLSRDAGVVRDIRLMIGDLIWEERAAWSRRK